MTLPSQSQFDSALTKIDLAENLQVSRGSAPLGLCCVSDRPARLLRHVSPIEWDNVILYGQYVLDRALVR